MASASNSCCLRGLLQPAANTSVAGQRFTGSTADPTARSPRRAADPWRTLSSILPNIVFGRDNGIRTELMAVA